MIVSKPGERLCIDKMIIKIKRDKYISVASLHIFLASHVKIRSICGCKKKCRTVEVNIALG